MACTVLYICICIYVFTIQTAIHLAAQGKSKMVNKNSVVLNMNDCTYVIYVG